MSVVTDALSVVVRKSVLNERYPGGTTAYEAACPNKTYCADRLITRVGFMSPQKVREWVRHLSRFGLIHLTGDDLIDIAVVDQREGYLGMCDWLEGGVIDQVPQVWLKGHPRGKLATPAWWTPESSASLQMIPTEEVNTRVLSLGPAGNVHCYLDYRTGRIVYTADEISSPPPEPPRRAR